MIRRLLRILRAHLYRLREGSAERRLEELVASEHDALREQIERFDAGLTSHAATCERLIRHVKRLEAESSALSSESQAALDRDDRSGAALCALRLESAERELVENRALAESAEKTFRDLVLARESAVAAAEARVRRLHRSIDALSEARSAAELGEMASDLVAQTGAATATLDRLTALVERQRIDARVRSQVARHAAAFLATGDLPLEPEAGALEGSAASAEPSAASAHRRSASSDHPSGKPEDSAAADRIETDRVSCPAGAAPNHPLGPVGASTKDR